MIKHIKQISKTPARAQDLTSLITTIATILGAIASLATIKSIATT